jgi:hypothetical protein
MGNRRFGIKDQGHHIIPRSRGGKIVKTVPADYHKAYHKLFENLTPAEILEYLKQVWFVSGEFERPLEWLNK